jgi:DNA polymerase-4
MPFPEPILHVDMDAFFVEVERLRRPELVGIPVVVGGGANRGVVASASYEARTFGIRSAMPTAAARRTCPQVTVVPPDHDEYQRVSELVFGIFRSVTPIVEGLSLDEAYLDVSGLGRHYSGSVEIGLEVRSRIRQELDLPASVGVASTKFVAKLASEAAKPDGLRHIRAAQTIDFLHALPIRALWGVGEATHATLEGMGVATVGDLAKLPERALERRLGPAVGRHLGALARGEDPRRVQPDHKTKSVSVSETYDRDLTSSEQIDTELIRLCDRLARRMRRTGLAGLTVGLTVRYSDFVTITRHATFQVEIDSSRALWHAIRQLKSRVQWDRPIRLLGVDCSGLVELGGPRQLRTQGSPKWDDLAEAVDNIRERFGSESVGPARLRDGASPSSETRSKSRQTTGSD